jgi:hypothetical protein
MEHLPPAEQETSESDERDGRQRVARDVAPGAGGQILDAAQWAHGVERPAHGVAPGALVPCESS